MAHPTIDDIHSAVHWALTYDLPALLAYRQVAHLDRSARWQADAALVARWRKATRHPCDVSTTGATYRRPPSARA